MNLPQKISSSLPGIAVRRTASIPLALTRQSTSLRKIHFSLMDARAKPAHDGARAL
jgi:hypothetical protein